MMKIEPCVDKKSTQKALLELLKPLAGHWNDTKTGFHIGVSTADYFVRGAEIEGFLRTLYGIVPLLAGGGEIDNLEDYIHAIEVGTDPESPAYWGPASPSDQRAVEMTVIAVGMLLVPEKLWEPLSERGKKTLADWLLTINTDAHYTNNWAYFIVFANLALKRVGMPYAQEKIDEMETNIEACYIGDGWYSDGCNNGVATRQRDYYIPMAMHFYALVYATLIQDENPTYSAVLKDRAVVFAQDFIHWFTAEGVALPFGRSQTYRMAQDAFWGALAFAGVEALPWGVIKGIYMRNLRWWLAQPIYTEDGVLSVGYAYPNLKMAEYYNSTGSPYWAFKVFFPLALAEDHPFWQAEEAPLPQQSPVHAQKHPYMLLCSEQDRSHVFCLTGGQYAGFGPTLQAAKYEKFAYSTAFGFSVPAGEYGLFEGAYDSALALCEDGDELYRVRRTCGDIVVKDEFMYTTWKPWNDVSIQTWLIPAMPWHIRIHKIVSARNLTGAEGGFSINRDAKNGLFAEMTTTCDAHGVWMENEHGMTAIVDLLSQRAGEAVRTSPNTNVLYARAMLPTLCGEIGKGETVLACAVLGQPSAQGKGYATDACPSIALEGDKLTVTQGDMVKVYMLNDLD